jgi:pimeloyl-ACP methyl ester carboxylesterase
MSRQNNVRPVGGPTRERLLAPIPLAQRRRELAGVSTAVLEGGEGPPVVLLHGQGEFGAVWTTVIPDLVRDHRLIVPDLPGQGASEVVDNPLDADGVSAWLDALIGQTCAEPPVLAGHLLGGAIAARYAAGHRDRLARLVLVDTMGLAWYRPAPSFVLPMIGFLAHPTARSRDRLFHRCFVDFDRVAEQAGDQWEPLLGYALECARTSSVQAALRRLLRLGAPPIAPGDLARITVPTTLIHGRGDLQVRLRVAQAASERYGWPLHVIDECRDDPAVEQPQAFLRALRTATASDQITEEKLS